FGDLVLIELTGSFHFAQSRRVRSDHGNPNLVSAVNFVAVALPRINWNRTPAMIGGDNKCRLILVLRMRLDECPQFLYELIRLPGRLQVSIIMSAMGKVVSLTISDIQHPRRMLLHIFQRIVMREGIEPH